MHGKLCPERNSRSIYQSKLPTCLHVPLALKTRKNHFIIIYTYIIFIYIYYIIHIHDTYIIFEIGVAVQSWL